MEDLPTQQPSKAERIFFWPIIVGALCAVALLVWEFSQPVGDGFAGVGLVILLVFIIGLLVLGIILAVIMGALSGKTSNTVRRKRMLMGFLLPLAGFSCWLALGVIPGLLYRATHDLPKTGEPLEYVCQSGRRLSAAFGDGIAVVTLEGTTTYTLESILIDGQMAYANEGGAVVLSWRNGEVFLREDGAVTFAACRAQGL